MKRASLSFFLFRDPGRNPNRVVFGKESKRDFDEILLRGRLDKGQVQGGCIHKTCDPVLGILEALRPALQQSSPQETCEGWRTWDHVGMYHRPAYRIPTHVSSAPRPQLLLRIGIIGYLGQKLSAEPPTFSDYSYMAALAYRFIKLSMCLPPHHVLHHEYATKFSKMFQLLQAPQS